MITRIMNLIITLSSSQLGGLKVAPSSFSTVLLKTGLL
nr:MAG TPA: hypothetical protein [Bacteriophage sp.]